jgi:predicted transcriptional regulator of viral defense system
MTTTYLNRFISSNLPRRYVIIPKNTSIPIDVRRHDKETEFTKNVIAYAAFTITEYIMTR